MRYLLVHLLGGSVLLGGVAWHYATYGHMLIGALDRPHRYTDAERLDTGALVQQWQAAGKQAWALPMEMQGQPDWGGEVERVLRQWVQPGDVVAVLTNGDFGGLRRRIHAGCVLAPPSV
jgi:hypothetical protein